MGILYSTQFFFCAILLCIKNRIYRENLRCSSNLPDVFQSFEKVEEFEKGSKNLRVREFLKIINI